MGADSKGLIAVLGSADRLRNPGAGHEHPYATPLKLADETDEACRALGAALAQAGWDILVYSGEPATGNSHGFIEPLVVDGYLSAVPAGAARKGSVRVLYSRSYPKPRFALEESHAEAFDFHADGSPDWEASFFRSLAEVDAALILGGGDSGATAGLVCLGRRIPLLAVGTFGAAGEQVWEHMRNADSPLPVDALQLLGRPYWDESSAPAIVASLKDQQDALDREREEVQAAQRIKLHSRGAFVALALFVVLWATLPIALTRETPTGWRSFMLLFGVPIIAGAVGGTVRTVLPRRGELEVNAWGSAALGAVAGGVSGVLYLVSQLSSLGDTGLANLSRGQYQTFVLFSVGIGILAGLALEATYDRLARQGAAPPESK